MRQRNIDILIPKGQFLVLSSGEYSDYHLRGLFVVDQDVRPADLKDEYLKINPDEGKEYGFNTENFLNFLKDKGLIHQVHYYEWLLESYGNIREMEVTEPPATFLGNNAGVNNIN